MKAIRRELLRTASGGLSVILLLTGCSTVKDYSLTYKLWNNEALRRFSEPAPEARLKLFSSSSGQDVLVQYDELSESKDIPTRRAYYVDANLDSLKTGRKPRFVSPQAAAGLAPIPLSPSGSSFPTSLPVDWRAVVSTNGHEFTLYVDGRVHGTYSLPVFQERNGNTARVCLSPLAVTGDVVMVGLVASFAALVVMAQSGVTITP